MVERIGSGGLQREAILAALRRQAAEVDQVHQAAAGVVAGPATADTAKPAFADVLGEGLRSVDTEVKAAERLPEDIALGRIDDFSEIAARIKRADLSFKFAMEIRNKLIDAYREVMRMQV